MSLPEGSSTLDLATPGAGTPGIGRTGTSYPITGGSPIAPGGPVEIGFFHPANGESAFAAVPGTSPGNDDAKRTYSALIDDINSRGGLAGHPIRPVWFPSDLTSSQPLDAQMQAACARFTEDHHVFAVVGAGEFGSLRSCLAARRTPHVMATNPYLSATDSTFRKYPLYFQVNMMSLDRFSVAYRNGLLEQGFLSGRWNASASCATESEPRLGLITYDRAPYRDVHPRVLAPAFATKGHPIVDAVFVSDWEQSTAAAGLGRISRETQSAVLKFASECIDHVIFMEDTRGLLSLFFMINAAKQRYTPRYGLSSMNMEIAWQDSLPDSGSQLRGSVGIGWCPYCDVKPEHFDESARRPEAAHGCLKVLARAGIRPTDSGSFSDALTKCDELYFLEEAVDGRRPLTRELLVHGVNDFGRQFASAQTYATFFSAARHDGAAGIRYFSFSGSCSCFRYTTPVRTL